MSLSDWPLTTNLSMTRPVRAVARGCVGAVGEIAAPAKEMREDVLVLYQGGPITMPGDFHRVAAFMDMR